MPSIFTRDDEDTKGHNNLGVSAANLESSFEKNWFWNKNTYWRESHAEGGSWPGWQGAR